MSKGISKLGAAIRNLDIKTPYGAKPERTQVEVPQTEAPRFETPQGYFMLAHSVFMNPVLRELTGDAFRVFIWMSAQAYRFKTSDGTLRASIGYINAGTGVSQATVSRILDALVKKKLVERVEVHSHKGNLWRVSPVAVGSPKREGPRDEGTQGDGGGASNEGSSSLNSREEAPQSEGQLNNSKHFKKSNSLSLMPVEVGEYLEGLRPAAKREAEMKACQELLTDFTGEELNLGFQQLKAEDPSWSKYHSPMAYLCKSMTQVLAQAGAAMDQRRSAEEAFLRQTKQAEAKARREREEDERWAHMERAFDEAFPDEEARTLAYQQYAGAVPFTGQALRRSYAVTAWWNREQSRFDAQQSTRV
jgi:hypothetical protein